MTEKPKARELNKVIRYTMWSVFKVETPLGDANRDELTAELSENPPEARRQLVHAGHPGAQTLSSAQRSPACPTLFRCARIPLPSDRECGRQAA